MPFDAGPETNDSLMQNYYYVLKNNPTNRISTIQGIINRLGNPTLNDIGPRKFEIATAESLLHGYLNDRRFANDPLDLFKYDGHRATCHGWKLHPPFGLRGWDICWLRQQHG
jgi:hypothetical protein